MTPPLRAGEAMGVLVLCLGNALRRDDAVALYVADALERSADTLERAADTLARDGAGVTVRRSASAGLYLLDDMEGFDRVVVVDAVRTGVHPAGTVLAFPLDALHAPEGPSPHAIGLPSALARARASGAPVPSRIEVVAIEGEELDEVGAGLTPAVAAAVPEAVAAVWRAVAALSSE